MKTAVEKLCDRQEARGRYARDFWVYFRVEEDGSMVVETSLLPAGSAVEKALRPLGFKKIARGGWRARVAAGDAFGAGKLAAAAARVLAEWG